MGAVQIVEQLTNLPQERGRTLEAQWSTSRAGGRQTLCHIRPAISTNPNERKISFMIEADLDRHQAREIGEHLVWVAEQMADFPNSGVLEPAGIRVNGRNWIVTSLLERRYDARGIRLPARRAYLDLIEHRDRELIHAMCCADLSPVRAREIGAYMIRLANQMSG